MPAASAICPDTCRARMDAKLAELDGKLGHRPPPEVDSQLHRREPPAPFYWKITTPLAIFTNSPS